MVAEPTPFEKTVLANDSKIVTLKRREVEADKVHDTVHAALTEAAAVGGPRPRYVVLKVVD